MRFAYADPPYPGKARKHYGADAREVNLELLIAHLETFDCWALSTSSNSLVDILPLCPAPPECRTMAWVKPFARFKKAVNPCYAWEPVLVCRPRKRTLEERYVFDWTSATPTLNTGTVGAKPVGFWYWLFDMIGMRPDDEFTDIFPGSGAGDLNWEHWSRQTRLAI
jgi:hypothetical protein